jgi:CubicO group peptidase (beta-lactamase class C family)
MTLSRLRIRKLRLLGVVALAACTEPDAESAGDLREQLESRLASAAADGFSGAALVTVDGVTLVATGHGLADAATKLPNGADVAYDFGSVLKDVTAAAVFKLADEGKVSLSDSLQSIFEDVPEDKAEITLLQVVQHRAGFDEYHDTEGDFEAMTRLEARQRIFAQELLFAPGSDESYSNAGYTLLADVIETVSGQGYTDYVRRELFEPAGMEHSGFFGEPRWQELDTAIGVGGSEHGANDPASWPFTWALVGNGGLVTTVSDLERWLVASWDGRVLTTAALEAYRTNYLSLAAATLEGKTVYSYGGGSDYGFAAFAVDCPEAKSRVVLATNHYVEADEEVYVSLLLDLTNLALTKP